MTPEGIEVRGTSIRIWFLYKGKRCKETLKGWQATPANIRKAGRLRAVIVSEISDGTFDYLARFPNSKKARELGNVASVSKSMTVEELFEKWLNAKAADYSITTLRNKRSVAKTCIQILEPEKLAVNVNYEDGLLLRSQLISGQTLYSHRSNKKGRSAGTVNSYMSLCAEVWRFACLSGYIDSNPFETIKPVRSDDTEPDPLEYDEFLSLINHPSITEQERNLWTVAVYTGLRHGEICALSWEDIDLNEGVIRVSRNLSVAGYFKVPKTKAGERTINLLGPAIDALTRQKALTYVMPEESVTVLLREPGKKRQDSCRWVFKPTRNAAPKINAGSHYSKNGLAIVWDSCMRRTGIRRRTPYQTRHTYACWMLTEDANPSWIARQMGHKDARMVMTTYGKFMPSQSGVQVEKLNKRFASVSHTCPIGK
ncbi:site-specific integrase [Salinivibrio sp. YCSC6]|uniref:site-specific integrase n=1 Tax=Salinivibrio sp. YCSC6 TaxID=2003370 RepID=UPI000BBC4176|nr:site-specific integrase [Salinivibrio sp. YCSC6]PCE67580.1 hypothetical protein B6G00_04330 [Salinivibrio sp. YCSC6]QCF35516.1 DUF3596 domain-containing protein [Salinivibrio sp. YCSC6]